MIERRSYLAVVAGLLALGVWVTQSAAQALVPLGDDPEVALLPAGISNADAELFGELVHLWKETDGSDVIHFIGDFELHLGARRLAAREAVVWVSPRKYQQTEYHRFEVVLWRDARVVDTAGSVTRGPALYVSFNSSGKIRVSADQRSDQPSSDSSVYERAGKVRAALKDRIPDEPTAPVTVLDLARAAGKPQYEVRPPISYQGRELTVQQIDGRNVVTVIGNVYVFRGEAGGEDSLELRADSAVVYLAPDAPKPPPGAEPPAEDDRPGRVNPGNPSGTAATGEKRGGALAESLSAGPTFAGAGNVEAVYLEGDIILSSGDRNIRATRLYYDFANDRALILDAVARFFEPRRGLPIVLRANEVRQLSSREFEAHKARFTTSEFATPHYHLGAEELTLLDQSATPQVAGPAPEGIRGTFTARDTTFNLGGVPLLYWPYVRGDLSETETSLQSVRIGYSDDFGAEFQSRWALFNLLGLEKPVGIDGSFLLDYFSERGPAAGVNLDYETDDSFGLFRSYIINDQGKDQLGGRLRDEDPDTDNRGRFTWRHRQFLPDDWQITFELSYLSDKNFMEEYFEPEFDRGKEQESLIYLKKQVDNWAFVTHLQYRIHNWLQTTERFPDTSFHLIGQPVGDFGTFFSESHAGFVRYRTPDRGLKENLLMGGVQDSSGTVARADTREELETPFRLGNVKVVPFGAVRGTTWDDAPSSGNLSRAFGSYGVRASTYAWKVFPEARSDLFDISGIRHIVKADATAWGSHTSVDGNEQFLFDENIEGIDEVDGASVGLRQRFQTKRGAPGKLRNVDVFTFDLEGGFFNDAERDEYTYGFTSPFRPENSISRNYINALAMYRVNDSTDLISEVNYDINDGEVDVFDLTYAVQRTPRLSYLIGFRYIGEIDSNLLGFGVNYKLNEKYTLAMREEFDLERGRTSEFLVGVIRKFPRWYVGVNFALDEIEDDFGISLSAWPEGLPAATVGSRRFTGLVDSVGIRPGS
jgi:hypothetical protein